MPGARMVEKRSVMGRAEGDRTGDDGERTEPQVPAMRIDRRGVWSCDGEPFARKDLVCLLASRLRRAADGGYELVLPCEKRPLPVEVEDVPFLAVEAFRSGTGEDQIISFRTNVDQIVTLDADHPLVIRTHAAGMLVPYIVVSEGMMARLTQAVYYELVALAESRRTGNVEQIGLWSSRQYFVLGRIG